ncbi:aminotransferase-like domain-containing protein [Streptomyces xantholiticus]
MEDYRAIADRLADDIARGRLRTGDQLPPQRRFARQHGIANSTAARVYQELIVRGLVVGEVGRGTFVRAAAPAPEPSLAEPADARVDLELNFPVLPGQPARLAQGLTRVLRPDAFAMALRPVGASGSTPAREAAASHLSRGGWAPDPQRLLFAGNGRQAIAAAIAAVVPAGARLGVEPLTYPVVKGIATRLGVTLVPLAVDDDGLVPDALVAAPALRAVYLQPALHNPLGFTMSEGRRADIAEVLERKDMYAIEDAIYGFLRNDLPPLATLAPERTIVVDSLSKRLSPGLTAGFLVTPSRITQAVASSLRSGAWLAQAFALEAATQWMTDGTAADIEQSKRQDAAMRQRITADRLAGQMLRTDPHAYHCWWELPDPWRAETFVAAAARRGIAVTPAAAFTVGTGHAPNAVRLALSSPPTDTLTQALDVLLELAHGRPEDAGPE